MNQQEAVDFVVIELGKHRSPDEVTRLLTERVGCPWDEAQQFVHRVQFEHRTKVAAHQSPLLILLAVITIVSGLVLYGYLGWKLMGFTMIIGASIGLWQSIRAMWK